MIKKQLRDFLNNRLFTPELRRNHRCLTAAQLSALESALTEHYFNDPQYYPDDPNVYLATPTGQADMADHLTNRLTAFRTLVVPWLDSVFPLRSATILEVGCGTGASTVALSEQGARVVGVDESQGALAVARVRCDLYGVEANFKRANAVELNSSLCESEVTAVIYFAVLEHMTWQERRDSLRAAWQMLQKGQYLVVIETPNRLWHTDFHTTSEPFFHWLPDDIAFAYSRLTQRKIFNEIFREQSEEAMVRFARWGRGVSYHDFVLSLDVPAGALPVASYMQLFLRKKRFEQLLRRYSRTRRDEARLQEIVPAVHPAFLGADLNFALRKP